MWAVYDEVGSTFAVHAADSAYNAHYDRPAVLALAGDVSGLKVLDAGCGPGFYAEELTQRGAEVVALDASATMIDLARDRLGDRATVLQHDLAEPLPFVDAAFDLVVCALVISYVDDRAAVFAEFARVLRPGGRVVVSTQHPTVDWLHHGGSYFAVEVVEEEWTSLRRAVPSWREPLTAFCAAATDSGLLIERLVEPQPAPSMKERWPDDWARLSTAPGFVILKLLKPPAQR